MFSSGKKLEYLDFEDDLVLVHLALVRCFSLTHKKVAAKFRAVNSASSNGIVSRKIYSVWRHIGKA